MFCRYVTHVAVTRSSSYSNAIRLCTSGFVDDDVFTLREWARIKDDAFRPVLQVAAPVKRQRR